MQPLIIANGTLPSKKIVMELLADANYIICADGGANAAKRRGITPNVILGDFDSLKTATKKFFNAVEQLYIPDQYSTDLEKAISFCIKKKFPAVTIVGATGNRIDHSTGSLGCFKKFRGKITLTIVDTVGSITAINKKCRFTTYSGEKISLIPLERCEGVTTKNLKYALKSDFLELGIQEGISNEAIAEEVSIAVKKGVLLLYRFHSSNR